MQMFTEEQANDYRKDIQTIISIKEKNRFAQ